MPDLDLESWISRFRSFVGEQMAGDAAHDLAHVRRVAATATALARTEGARLAVVVPAAWLHDCVALPKDHPERHRASALAAEAASDFLRDAGYPADLVPDVAHAIEAHSFSAGLAPRTPEAAVVQDADRLDALGAIGIARTFAVGGALGASLYNASDPFPTDRPLDDRRYVVDHFYAKLLGLAGTMRTAAGRREAERRTAFLHAFLDQLRAEIGAAE